METTRILQYTSIVDGFKIDLIVWKPIDTDTREDDKIPSLK